MGAESKENRRPEWPIVIFEVDSWPVVVKSIDELPGLYDDGYWDEVASAFDSRHRAVLVELRAGGPDVELIDDYAGPAFAKWARGALRSFDRQRRTRWRAADSVRSREIDQLTTDELWKELMFRFAS